MLRGSLSQRRRTSGRPGCRCQGERRGPRTYPTFKSLEGRSSGVCVPALAVWEARAGVEAWKRSWDLALWCWCGSFCGSGRGIRVTGRWRSRKGRAYCTGRLWDFGWTMLYRTRRGNCGFGSEQVRRGCGEEALRVEKERMEKLLRAVADMTDEPVRERAAKGIAAKGGTVVEVIPRGGRRPPACLWGGCGGW